MGERPRELRGDPQEAGIMLVFDVVCCFHSTDDVLRRDVPRGEDLVVIIGTPLTGDLPRFQGVLGLALE